MSSDTGPAELAEIIQDDRKFRTYMVLSQARLENKLDIHISDDQRQFSELKAGQKTVSSSVGQLETIKHKFQGGWAALAVIGAVLVVLVDIGFKVWEHVK